VGWIKTGAPRLESAYGYYCDVMADAPTSKHESWMSSRGCHESATLNEVPGMAVERFKRNATKRDGLFSSHLEADSVADSVSLMFPL
jgi:hypothetical protein